MTWLRGLTGLSVIHSLLFTALLAAWLVPGATTILGWTHGIFWIGMSLLVTYACVRAFVPWSLLALVSVVGIFLGPFASTWGFVRETRRRDRAGISGTSAPAARV